jgi:hypothetical protein
MQHGIGELMGYKAGNNQYFILFKVAGTNGKWRTSQVHNLLDNLGLVATAYMDHPKIIGFAHNDMDNHDIVKLIKRAHISGEAYRFRWVAAETSSRVFKKLAANLSVPIMASQGSQRERKAPERLKMTEEPKKPRRKGPSAEEIQAKRQRLQPVEQHYESEEEVVVSQPSDEHVSLLQEAIRKAAAEAQPASPPAMAAPSADAQPAVGAAPVVSTPSAEAQPAVAAPPVVSAEAQPAVDAQPPVVQAVYMPNFSAVYSEAEESAEIKRLEAHLADKDAEIKRVVEAKDKHLADKDAEIKRVVEAKDKHLADKDKQLAEKDRALKAAMAALAALSNP